MRQPDWDLDYSFGHEGEARMNALLGDIAEGGLHVEVKTDRQWVDTGNVYVETSCKGYPSGLSTTRAEWWAFNLAPGCSLLVRTEDLRSFLHAGNGKPAQETDGSHPTQGWLVKTANLLAWMRGPYAHD